MLTAKSFARADKGTPKRDDAWAFVVDPVTHELPENSRAIFDRVANDQRVAKIVLARSKNPGLEGRNVVVTPLLSRAGGEHLLGARVVFLSGRPLTDLGVRPQLDLHHLIGVRRGIMLLKAGRTAELPQLPQPEPPPETGPLPMLHKAPKRELTAVLTASDVDHVAEISAHWPARYGDGWRTGVPMHDYLLTGELPADLAAQESRLRALLGGRRLLLVCPAPRGADMALSPHPLGPETADVLLEWSRTTDSVIGVRESVTDPAHSLLGALGEAAVDVSASRFESTAVALRVADALLTDYDGSALDFTVTGRPVIGFTPDLPAAADHLLYNPKHMLPGPVCDTVDELGDALANVFQTPSQRDVDRYERIRDLLIDHLDGQNSARVVDRVYELVNGGRR